MGASRSHHNEATSDQNTATEHQTVDRLNLGRFPELTPVHRVQPNPVPRAGDITPRSEWTSSSTASIRSWANGEVAADGEAAILAVADRFEPGEASVGVGSSKTDATSVLKGLGEVGFGAEGVNGGIELAKLILALTEASDVGSESPVAQFVGCLS